jgi:hypothetical protein
MSMAKRLYALVDTRGRFWSDHRGLPLLYTRRRAAESMRKALFPKWRVARVTVSEETSHG